MSDEDRRRFDQTEDAAIRQALDQAGGDWPIPSAVAALRSGVRPPPPRMRIQGRDLPLVGDENASLVGNTVLLAPGDQREIVRVTGADDLSGVLCVALSAVTPTNPTSGDVVRAAARVRFGTGGAQHDVDVDVHRGTIFSVPGSMVRVGMENEGTQISLLCGASISYLPNGGRITGATRTRYRDTSLGTSTSDTFDVPTFARRLHVYRTPQTADYRLEFLDSNAIECYEIGVAANANPDPILLSNDITTIQLANLTGATIVRARLVFDLSF